MDKPKVNILYVITKLELGGAQLQLLELISRLDKDKYRVFLFTAAKGRLFARASSVAGLEIKPSFFLERPINPFKDILALAEIHSFIKKNNIDIVHTHSSKAGILGRLAAGLARTKTIVHTVHGWSFNDFQSGIKRKIFIVLERLCGRISSKLIVVCRSDMEKGLANRIGSAEKYALVRYGVNYGDFQTGSGIRAEPGINRDDLVVGSVACFKPQKAPLDFIRLASLVSRRLPKTKFILAGDGAMRKKIEEIIYRLGLEKQVILTGWRNDIPRFLASIDIFALTSLWEGLPVSLLEAMAAGLPTVVTDTGGVRDVVDDGKTGFLAKPRDVEAMAERIVLLLNNAAMRQAVGRAARERLRDDFTIEKMVNDTVGLYELLAQASGQAPSTIPVIPPAGKN